MKYWKEHIQCRYELPGQRFPAQRPLHANLLQMNSHASRKTRQSSLWDEQGILGLGQEMLGFLAGTENCEVRPRMNQGANVFSQSDGPFS